MILRSNVFFAFLAVTVVSAIPLFAFSMMKINEERLRKTTGTLIALAIGAMIGDIVFHIFPEVANERGTPVFFGFALLGAALFWIVERFIHWHHHADHEHHQTHPAGKLVLIGDGVHNFVDGLLIAGAFLVSPGAGFATTIAVVFHEIPQEIGDFSVLLHAGYSKKRAIRANFISACAAILGTAVGIIGSELIQGLPPILLSVTAGGFLYISLVDLLPWVIRKKDTLPFSAFVFFLGVAVMYTLTLFE